MTKPADDTEREIARRMQEACIAAAIAAYEDAAMSGLCHEGAFEAAISAMQMIDVDDISTRS